MDFGPNLRAGLWPADDYAEDRALCIAFANTLSWRGKANPTERLPDPAAWFAWIEDNAALPHLTLEALRARANASPEEAMAAYEKAITFREALYNLLCVDCRDNEPAAKDRMVMQDVLCRAMANLEFEHRDGQWRFELSPNAVGWDSPLYGPALSAAQLLTSGYASKVRSCGRDECQWLFIDLTKNHSRKWCSMQSCGNVVKARACYARRKKKDQAEPTRMRSTTN